MTDEKTPRGFNPSRLIPLAVLVIGLILFFVFDLGRFISLDALRENRSALEAFVARNALVAGLIFALIYVVAVAFSLPVGALLTIAGGFLFGTIFGTVWVVLGATLGATILFLAARAGIGDAVRSRMSGSLKKMEEGFRKDAFSYLLVLRLVPLFPFWLVNLAPAFLGVNLRTYFLATLVGIIPGSFVYASVGNGLGALFDAGEEPSLGVIFEPQILIPIVGLAVLALIPVIYRRLQRRNGAAS